MTDGKEQVTFLTLPGIYGSGPEHWQTRWEASHPRFRRVEQDDWEHPQARDWVANIVAAVEATPAPIVFVAHSLGCHAVARASNEPVVAERVTAALLVAPADLDDERNADYDMGSFRPMVLQRLPFRSLVVASTNDPTCDPGRAEAFAAAWGSRLVLAGALGHINSDSGLGDWPDGKRLLHEVIAG
jgi:uncharacterized protein